MRHVLLAALVAALGHSAAAQSEGVLQPEDDVHQFLDRQQVLGHLPAADLGARPFSVAAADALLDTLAARDSLLGRVDRQRLAELRGEATGGLFGAAVARATRLYADGRSFAHVAGTVGSSEYGLEVAPLAFLEGGPVVQTEAEGAVSPAYRLSRGLRAGGHVGRVFFETRVLENQTQIPLGEVQRRQVTAPRLGFVVYPNGDVPSYDYLLSTGVVGYRGDVLEARFGRDRNSWGFGRESVALSDYAAPYDHLQLRWNVWRLSFQSLYGRTVDPRPAGSRDGLLPQRYVALHRLALGLGRGIEVEAFETVVFASDTSAAGRRSGFEIGYLNPFQFYRGTERDLGSPDNVLLGAGASWRPTSGLRLYGQGILDELTASRFFDDYWGNKWAFIAGASVADPGVPGVGRVRGLDLRVEYARLRPYLYSHRTTSNAFVHSGDGLGHPAGPNASDLTLSTRYRPTSNLTASLDAAYTVRGRDTAELNFGSDPTRSYVDRVSSDDVPTLQGVRQREWLVEGSLGARLLPDLQAGAALRFRSIDDQERGRVRFVSPSLYLQWGLPFASDRY